MNKPPKRDRFAALVVISKELAVRDISAAMGVDPDQFREIGSIRVGARFPIPAKDSSWELRECGDSFESLDELISRLTVRVLPLRPKFEDLRSRGCAIKLELVQWISARDVAGPGFAIDAAMIELLSAVAGFVDVDQYVDEAPGG